MSGPENWHNRKKLSTLKFLYVFIVWLSAIDEAIHFIVPKMYAFTMHMCAYKHIIVYGQKSYALSCFQTKRINLA